MEQKPLKIKPKFWGDALWVYPVTILMLSSWFGVEMYRFSGGGDEWMGLAVIMDILVLPMFILLWLDNISSRAVFEENQLILKGFLHKQKIEYKDIRGITFSDSEQPTLIHFNPKSNSNNRTRLFIWNHSINILIDEIKNRTNITVNGYPDKINRANFYGKIWMLVILAVTAVLFTLLFRP